MKMKKSLLSVVFLLATSSAMAAMSYNQASVVSDSELKVVSTNQALLSLEPNAHWNWGNNFAGTKDNTAVVKDGELYFEFGKGVNGGTGAAQFYGLQPNSEYAWNPLFTLRNKSADTIKVTVRAEGEYAQYITLGTVSQSTVSNPAWGTKGQPLVINSVSKETNSGLQNIRNIAVKISLPSGVEVSPTELEGSIIVESEAIN